MNLRGDLELVRGLIHPGARVLDLGCGDGALLDNLARSKGVNGYGLDRDANNIALCIAKGVNVIEQDLDDGLSNFVDRSFNMVVMTEALQAVKAPRELLREMLRIGEECIITFPNFGHWRCRLQLTLGGYMPVSKHLPHNWFDTPNIHLCTFKDFEQLCIEEQFTIIERRVVDDSYRESIANRMAPNVFGTYGFYRLGRSE